MLNPLKTLLGRRTVPIELNKPWQAKRLFITDTYPLRIQVWGFKDDFNFRVMLATVERVCREAPFSHHIEQIESFDPRDPKGEVPLVLPNDEFPAIVLDGSVYVKRKVDSEKLKASLFKLIRYKTRKLDQKIAKNRHLLQTYDFIKIRAQSYFHHPSDSTSSVIIIPREKVSINEFGALHFDREVGFNTFHAEDEQTLIDAGYHVLDYTLRDNLLAKQRDVFEEIDLTEPEPTPAPELLPSKFLEVNRGKA